MRFQIPLVPARLIRRYKRFLADMQLDDGREVTVHCPNPGAMLGLADPGARCWLEPNDDPRKKLRFGWRLVELADGVMANIDTSLPNRVVAEALHGGAILGFQSYDSIRAEVPYGVASRVDFMLCGADQPDALVEVKSVTLRRDGWAEFPDCVTKRGTTHLAELTEVARDGRRAVMLYLIGRTGETRFRIASDLDLAYARAFDLARDAGVEMLAFACEISPIGLNFGAEIPVDTARQSPPVW
jgi:sugar fermentation stimulation protein A